MARDVIVRITAEDSFSTVFQKFNTALQDTTEEVGKTGQALTQQKSAFDQVIGSVQGFIVAYAGIKGIQAVGEMIQLGDAANRTQAVFSQLTSSIGGYASNMAALRAATGGVVDDMTLQQGASKLLSMGLATNTDEMARLTEMAVKLGSAMGKDAQGAVSDFSLLLSNQSILRLDNFGISSAKVREEIKRLQDQFEGIDKSEAFKMAVLKVGQESLDKLGSAADAAATPLDRLKTSLQNFGQDFAQNVAEGLQGLIGIAQVLPTIISQQQQLSQGGAFRQNAGQTQAFAGIIGAPNDSQAGMTDEQKIAELNRRQSAALADAAKQHQDAYWSAYVAEWEKRPDITDIGAIYAKLGVTREQADAGGRAWANSVRDAYEAQAIQRAAAQTSLSAIMTGVGDFTGRGVPQYLENAQKYHDELDQISSQYDYMKTLADAGFISTEQLDAVGTMRDKVSAMADQADRAAAAFGKLKLSDVFGQTGGGMGGEISDAIIAQMRKSGRSDADIAAAQKALDLGSGRQTGASVKFQEQIVPMLAGMNPDQMASAMKNLQTFMQQGELAGLTPAQIAQGLSYATGFAQVGGTGQFTVKAGQSAGDIMAQTGMTLPQLLAATGASGANVIRTGTYGTMGGFQATQGFDLNALISSLLMGRTPGQGAANLGATLGDTTFGVGFGPGNAGTAVPGKTADPLKQSKDTLADMRAGIDDVISGAGDMYTEFGKSTSEIDRLKSGIDNLPGQKHVTVTIDLNDPFGIWQAIQALGLAPTGSGDTPVQNNGGNVPGQPAGVGTGGGSGGKGKK